MKNVILISPTENWNIEGQRALSSGGFKCDFAQKGRDAQLMIHKNEYNYAFLDLTTTDHSGMEVFKFLRTKNPLCRVFLIVPSEEYFEGNKQAEEKLVKAGAVKVLKGTPPTELMDQIVSLGVIKKWETIAKVEGEPLPEEEASIDDGNFTSIRLEDFFEDVIAVTDFYVRIRANRYVKVVHKGEKISGVRFQKYIENGAEFIYFPTADRFHFVGQQNHIAQAVLRVSKSPSAVVLKASASAADKFIEEIYTVGIQPQLLEEGKALCQNLYEMAQKDEGLKKLLLDYERFNPEALSEAFLVTLFSSVIVKNLAWVGPKTIETLGTGALLHDVGVLQLPDAVQKEHVNLLTPAEFEIYKEHPNFGAQTVSTIPGLNQGVKLIIQQHHEHIDGSGYPARLSSSKIYPLAKVVALADGFSEFLKEKRMTPLEGLKVFLSNKETIMRYDPELIKNLILGIK